MTELWLLQIEERHDCSREEIIKKLITFLDSEGIPADVRGVFRVDTYGVHSEKWTV